MIGGADIFFRGIFILKEQNWQNSIMCTTAGFLAMLSSEVSAIVIFLITMDRFFLLRFPFNRRLHLSRFSAWFTCTVAWLAGIIVATMPTLQPHWMFYSQNSICLPLPITRRQFPGQQYSFGVFIVFNCYSIARTT